MTADVNLAFLLMTAGLLAICWEVSGRSTYVTGVAGAALTVWSLYQFSLANPRWQGLALALLSILLFLVEYQFNTRSASAGAATLALVAASRELFSGANRISNELCFTLPWLIGGVIGFLLTTARRARVAKSADL